MTGDVFYDPDADPTPRVVRGRYRIVEPDGRARLRTRVSNFARTIVDTYHLHAWQQRMLLLGVAGNRDIADRAAAGPPDDKARLDALVGDALEHAGAHAAPDRGRHLHDVADQAERGHPAPDPVDAEWLERYQALIRFEGLTPVADWTERVVRVDHEGLPPLAGRLDRIYSLAGGVVIGDIKTGSTVSYGALEHTIQLACYAHASAGWDRATRSWEPMPGVSRSAGVIIHVPADPDLAHLDAVHWMDLDQGMHAARLSQAVRKMRNAKFTTSRPEPGTNVPWLMRIVDADSVAELRAVWADVPEFERPRYAVAVAARRRVLELANDAPA